MCAAQHDTERSLPIEEDREGHRFELRLIDCPTCGPGPTTRIGLRGGVHHRYGLGITSTIVRCDRCSLLYPNPLPVPLNRQALYGDPQSYFFRQPERARIDEYRTLIRSLIARSSMPTPSLLDVGSGRGDLLAAARLEGLSDTVGLEISDAMIEHARRQHAITVLPMTLEEYVSEDPRLFDAVVLNAVIEHVYDPDSLLRHVAAVLRPGGLLYIDTPRDPNLLTWVGNGLNHLLGRRWVYNLSPTWPPYHLFGFTPRSMSALLHKHQFRVESIRVHNDPIIFSRGGIVDRVRSMIGTQILRLGNLTSTGSNMYIWAQRQAVHAA